MATGQAMTEPSPPTFSVAQALQQAASQGLARVDAQMLLLHLMQQPAHARAWLITHDGDGLSAEQQARWAQLCALRQQGTPVAYLTGNKEFYGLDLAVDSRVLDPRPDTETLVDWALELMPEGQPVSVVDLGTGSGAIALALQSQRPAARVIAVDASADAKIDIAGQQIKVGVRPDILKNAEATIPLGRGGTPDEAAGAVYLFCQPESDYISGQTLMCTGGLTGV